MSTHRCPFCHEVGKLTDTDDGFSISCGTEWTVRNATIRCTDGSLSRFFRKLFGSA